MKRPYKLKWTDSCRHTRSYATYHAAQEAAHKAPPCKVVACRWIIQLGDDVLASGLA